MRRKVPKKIVLLGDIAEARRYIGVADSQLAILEEQLMISPLNLKQGRRVYRAGHIEIECIKILNITTVVITAATRKAERGKAAELYKECFCNCNFATGIVLDYFDELRWPDPNARYSVEACNKKNIYVLYDGCGMTDFTEILPLSEVTEEQAFVSLVMLYDIAHEVVGNCLSGPADSTACCPVVPEGLDLVGDATMYKIMPFQNVNFVEWLSDNKAAKVSGCT